MDEETGGSDWADAGLTKLEGNDFTAPKGGLEEEYRVMRVMRVMRVIRVILESV